MKCNLWKSLCLLTRSRSEILERWASLDAFPLAGEKRVNVSVALLLWMSRILLGARAIIETKSIFFKEDELKLKKSILIFSRFESCLWQQWLFQLCQSCRLFEKKNPKLVFLLLREREVFFRVTKRTDVWQIIMDDPKEALSQVSVLRIIRDHWGAEDNHKAQAAVYLVGAFILRPLV